VAFGDRIFPGAPARCTLRTSSAANHYCAPLVAAVALLVAGVAAMQGWIRVAG
jgi:hypothetical protein